MAIQVLDPDGCHVWLLDGLIRQGEVAPDNIQHTLEKVQMVTATIWSVNQLRYLPGENTRSHPRWCPGVTGIGDDVLAKVDSKTNHDIAGFNLIETT